MRLITALILSLGASDPGPPASEACDAVNGCSGDPLGDLIVESSRRSAAPLRLPKVGIIAADDLEPSRELLAIVRRDLELSFEVDLVEVGEAGEAGEPVAMGKPGEPEPADSAPTMPAAAGEGSALSSSAHDRWRRAGAEMVILLRAEPSSSGPLLHAQLLDMSAEDDDGPVFKRSQPAPEAEGRRPAHRLSDALLGAITGYTGPFASSLAFVQTRKGARRVVTLDADGRGLRVRSPEHHLALSPAFGPEGALYWAASVDRGSYRLYREGVSTPVAVPVRGSIYGVGFSFDRRVIALSIADGEGLRVYSGAADTTELSLSSAVPMAVHPAFTPTGTVVYAGAVGRRQRIYVGKRAVSPRELSASAPDICRHPEGVRLVYGVATARRESLVVSDENGREAPQLLRSSARRTYPACSPDGRVVAFFSTGEGGAGPGLYLMRVDGRRPAKKIADAVGDSLRWARMP